MVQLQLVPCPSAGLPIVVVDKQFDDRHRFEREVRWLTGARGHPVARLHSVDPAEGRYRTHFIGGHTLATTASSPRVGQDLVRRVWAGVEGLHRSGMVHGALQADHVVIGGDGPRLVSPRGGDDPLLDLAGLGRLIDHLGRLWLLDDVHHRAAGRWIEVGRRIEAAGHGRHQLPATAVRAALAELDDGRRSKGRWLRTIGRHGR